MSCREPQLQYKYKSMAKLVHLRIHLETDGAYTLGDRSHLRMGSHVEIDVIVKLEKKIFEWCLVSVVQRFLSARMTYLDHIELSQNHF